MRCRMVVAGLVMIAMLLVAPSASAGGWWSYAHLEGGRVAAGETVLIRSGAAFATVEDAEAARTRPYYAYLVRGHDRSLLRRAMTKPDPARWWRLSPDAELVRVGELELSNFDANLADARVRITVPAGTDRGRWHLMFCDDGCRTPMGSVIPTPVRVTTFAGMARTARRMSVLAEQRDHEIADLRGQLQQKHVELGAQTRRATEATEQLHAQENATPPVPAPAAAWSWSSALVGAVGALLLGGVALWLRRRSRGAGRDDPPADVPERQEAAPAARTLETVGAWDPGE